MRQIEFYATFELIDYVFRYNFKDLHIYIQKSMADAAPKKKLNREDFTFKNKQGETLVKKPGDINGIQFMIKDLKDCVVQLLDHTGQIQVDRCEGCTFFIGPIKSSLFIRDCKNCNVHVACSQFRCRDLYDSKVYLFASNDPIIESSNNLTFYPYNVTYPKLREHATAADLPIAENKWDLIFDFTKKKSGSNFSIGDAKDWKIERIQVEGLEEVKDAVFPYPQKYGGTVPDGAKFGSADDTMQQFGVEDMAKGKHASLPEAGTEQVACFFVLGGPGSGKGTNCAKLVKEHGFVHLSAGDLLRAERDSGSPNGELINNIIMNGQIVPVEITVNLIKNAIEKAGGASKKFLIDGFPRNEDNYQGWNKVMGSFCDVKFVLFLDCEEQAMIDRINKRAAESAEVRNDDNIEVLKKRFKTFREQSMPIVEIYEKEGKVRRINSNQEADKVYVDVLAAFEGYIDAKQPSESPREPKTIKANPAAVNAAVNTPRGETERDGGAKSEGGSSTLYGVLALTAAVALVSGYYFYKQ